MLEIEINHEYKQIKSIMTSKKNVCVSTNMLEKNSVGSSPHDGHRSSGPRPVKLC